MANCLKCGEPDATMQLRLRFVPSVPAVEPRDYTFYFCGDECWPHEKLRDLDEAVRLSQRGGQANWFLIWWTEREDLCIVVPGNGAGGR